MKDLYRRPYVVIDSIDKPVYTRAYDYIAFNPVILASSKFEHAYHTLSANAIPLLVNVNLMEFQLFKNDVVADTLTIEYKIEPTIYAGDECNDLLLIGRANVFKCYTKGHLFEVRRFH